MSLESYYNGMKNIVLRSVQGEPSVFVRHPKQNSSEFDAS